MYTEASLKSYETLCSRMFKDSFTPKVFSGPGGRMHGVDHLYILSHPGGAVSKIKLHLRSSKALVAS